MSNGISVEGKEADFIMTVSSDLIAEVMQRYFDRLYREKVQIVDLTPASDGYSFSIAFVKQTKEVKGKVQQYGVYANGNESVSPALTVKDIALPFDSSKQGENGRDSKGRFTRLKGEKDHDTTSGTHLQGT